MSHTCILLLVPQVRKVACEHMFHADLRLAGGRLGARAHIPLCHFLHCLGQLAVYLLRQLSHYVITALLSPGYKQTLLSILAI